jgi:soluble lytic murein transglycosylase-like protein
MYYTDRPPHEGYQLVLKSLKAWREPAIDYRAMQKNRQRFSPAIAETAKRHDMPVGLLHAVIATESAYDPEAVSRTGAVGLMQLMPDTAKRYGIRNRRDPAKNLSGGARYLKDLLLRFDNDIELALAGYNAGENAVEKYGNQVPPFEETQTYVRKVMSLYREYAPEAD